ncbi:MAG: erythromycin esterase family protein [Myxococcaceae bacterium]|nr:erythromycin esterase family protein [Myxococcaceae bacterium]
MSLHRSAWLFLSLVACGGAGRVLTDAELEATAAALRPADEGLLEWARSVSDAGVVGVGESTHGSHELQLDKLKALEVLSATGDLVGIGFEVPVGEALDLDRYVQGGEGDVRGLVARLVYWVAATEAMVSLVEWLRAFNAQRPPVQRIHFFGFDTQHPWRALQTFASRWRALDPAAAERGLGAFACVAPVLEKDLGVGRARLQAYDALIAAVVPGGDARPCLEQCRAATAAALAGPTDADFRYVATTACGWFAQVVASTENGVYGGWNQRDQLMAENALRFRELHGNRRVLVSAHDGHLRQRRDLPAPGALDLTTRQAPAAVGEELLTMGLRLQVAEVGYTTLSLLTARGTVRAFSEQVSTLAAKGVIQSNAFTAPRGSLSGQLSRLGRARVMLPVAGGPAWLSEPIPMLSIGSGFSSLDLTTTMAPAAEFDAFLFTEETSSSKVMPELEIAFQ